MPHAAPTAPTPEPSPPPETTAPARRDMPDLSALVALLGTVWRYRGTFLAVTGLVLGLAAVAVSRLDATYRATTEILLTQRPPRATPEGEPAVQRARPRLDRASEIEVLTSRKLLGEVVARRDLVRAAAFNPALGREPGLLETLGLAAAPAPMPRERQRARTVGALQQRLTVRPRGQSNVIAVTVEGGDAARAAGLANAVADRYLAARRAADARAARSVTDGLREQVARLRDDLETAERKAQRYRREAGLVTADGTTPAAVRITTLTEQLGRARTKLDDARAKVRAAARARERGTAAETAVLQSERLGALRDRAGALRRQRADLATTYGRKHPKIRAVTKKLREQRRAIDRAERDILDGLRADAAVAERRVRRLRDRLATARQRAADRKARAVRLTELERRVAAQREVYETMLAQLKRRTLGPLDDRPDARIISRADPPARPASPNVPLMMALAGLLAVPSGGLAALLRAQLDAGIADRAEAEAVGGLPVLAAIPEVPARRRGSPADAVVAGRPGMFPDAVRRLATTLLGAQPGRTPTSVLVTAPDTRDGKSTLALALARTYAATGEAVLLVEADLRKPHLAATLGIARTPGLAEVLGGAAGADAAIGLDPASRLHVLPAGGPGAARPAGLDTDDVAALLRAAGRHYDRIVLDTPPVLFVHESVALGAVADACVVAVRWRRTRPATLRRALTELGRTGSRTAGLALTRIDRDRYAGTGAGDAVAYGRRARGYYGA
jgi:uncharacterized protein involved in exopolysaccharide biosynthesis